MTEPEIFRRLYDLSESDAEGLGKLSQEIGLQCREPVKILLAEWVAGPPQRETPCAFICAHLKELALAEMLRNADVVAPVMRVHLMEMVVTQQLAFRELILTALEPLLQDLTPARNTAASRELRNRDTAYLLVRKLVPVKAGEAEHFSAEGQFTALEPDRRDAEIDEWVLSETWKEIFQKQTAGSGL